MFPERRLLAMSLGVHHTCTTREGQTRSIAVTHEHPETPADLRKYANVLISGAGRGTPATGARASAMTRAVAASTRSLKQALRGWCGGQPLRVPAALHRKYDLRGERCVGRAARVRGWGSWSSSVAATVWSLSGVWARSPLARRLLWPVS